MWCSKKQEKKRAKPSRGEADGKAQGKEGRRRSAAKGGGRAEDSEAKATKANTDGQENIT